jgi:hypothetical protein
VILILGKFKVLHGFESVLAALFFIVGRIFTCLTAGENRAFRGCALSRSGHIAPQGAPPAGRCVLLRNPYNRLRYLKASFAVKVDADFRFEIVIAAARRFFLWVQHEI